MPEAVSVAQVAVGSSIISFGVVSVRLGWFPKQFDHVVHLLGAPIKKGPYVPIIRGPARHGGRWDDWFLVTRGGCGRVRSNTRMDKAEAPSSHKNDMHGAPYLKMEAHDAIVGSPPTPPHARSKAPRLVAHQHAATGQALTAREVDQEGGRGDDITSSHAGWKDGNPQDPACSEAEEEA